MSDIFEKAALYGLRYSYGGNLLTTEDLFKLPLTSKTRANLNDIAKTINNELKLSEEEDFVGETSKGNTTAQLKMEIVKYVINYRKKVMQETAQKAEKQQQKQRILQILADKQDQSLQQMDEKALKDMLADL